MDQHFVRRRRHNRLLSLVLENPGLLGVGIDEGTAVWVKPDHTFEVLHVSRQGARYGLAHARVVRQR